MVERVNKSNAINNSKLIISQKEIENKTFYSNSLFDSVEKKENKSLTKEEYLAEKAKIEAEYKKNGGDLSKLSMPSDDKLKKIFEDGKIDDIEAMELVIDNKITFGGVNLEGKNLKEVTQDKNGLYTALFKNGVKVSYEEQPYNFKNRINSDEDNNTFIDYTNVKTFEGTPKTDMVMEFKSNIETFKGNGGDESHYGKDYLNGNPVDNKPDSKTPQQP